MPPDGKVISLAYWVVVRDSVELWRGQARDADQAAQRSGLVGIICDHVEAGGRAAAGYEIKENYINYVIARACPSGEIMEIIVVYITPL